DQLRHPRRIQLQGTWRTGPPSHPHGPLPRGQCPWLPGQPGLHLAAGQAAWWPHLVADNSDGLHHSAIDLRTASEVRLRMSVELTLIIPVKDEEAAIGPCLDRVIPVLEGL